MSAAPEALLKKLSPPMLATLASEPPRDESNWVFEVKYDGFRAVSALSGGELAMWSRNGLDLQSRFPTVAKSLRAIKVDEAVMDGEVVALDASGTPRFQLLQRSEAAATVYVAFDLLWLNGVDLRRQPLESRRELLEKLLKRAPKGVVIAQQTAGRAADALAAAAKAGQEGLIGKLRGSHYENRRSKVWIKLKAQNNQELAIIGYTPSTHSDKEIGALLLGVQDGGELRFAGKVGTGFSAKLRTALRDMLVADKIPQSAAKGAPRMRDATWVKPRYVAQVSFTEWTTDGKLRHPSFLGLRDDKKVSEVTRERAEPPATKASATTKSAAKKRAPKSASDDATPKKSTRARKGAATPAPAAEKAAPAAKPKRGATPTKRVAAPEVKLTNPDRLLYPRDGITKQDVADYFAAVSKAMINTLRDRPVALEHWNQGIHKGSWFHQNIADGAQEWMTFIDTPTRTSDRTVRHLVVDRPETLRWLAQYSALTVHMWSSRGVSIESPDWVVFDLDPAKGKGIEQAIETALVLRRVFEDMEIPSVPKTSGKRGIHLFVPLAKGHTHEEAAEFSFNLASAIASQLPDVTVERAIAARRGRLYLDALQNGYGKTVVAPYSLRAIDGAPVSAPLDWSEVNKKLDPLKYNLRTMPDRLARVGDRFADALKGGIKLSRYRKN